MLFRSVATVVAATVVAATAVAVVVVTAVAAVAVASVVTAATVTDHDRLTRFACWSAIRNENRPGLL